MGSREGWSAGAWPLRGIGPREGLPPGVVWPSRRDPRGEEGPTGWQAQSGEWRRAGPNLWVPADVELTARQRVVEAAASLPAYGGVTGWAALCWLGARWFEGTQSGHRLLPVPLAIGLKSIRSREGIVVSQEIVRPLDLIRHEGLRVTTAVRSVAYEMRKATTDEEAMIAFEMAAYDDLVSIEELGRFTAEQLWVRQGVERVRRVLPLLEENSWSPAEVSMRCTWTDLAHLPRPLANRPVFDLDGRFIGTPDLIDPWAGVYGQYDGALHLAGEVRHRDVATEAAFRRVGLEGVVMMAGDQADRRSVVRRLHEAYARAAERPAEARSWTLTPPPGWVETASVAQRRALSPYERARVLRYRRAA